MNLIAERGDEWGLDKWIEEAHSPSFKSRTHFQLCLFYRLWASTKSLVNLNVTFMLNQANPISIQSGEYLSLCCIIMDSSESQIHSSRFKGQTQNIKSAQYTDSTTKIEENRWRIRYLKFNMEKINLLVDKKSLLSRLWLVELLN